MSSAEPLRASDDPTRDRLVAAAAAVFAEKGYDRAGVQEIARRAGLTTGAIYGRFTGKAELLHAAIHDHAYDELEQLFNQHGFEGHASSILHTVGAHLVTPPLECEQPDEGELLLEAFVAGRRDDDVRAVLLANIEERAQLLSDLVEAAKADGSIDPALDTESTVTFCHAVGLGFLLLGAVRAPLPQAQPWEQLIARLVDALAPTTGSTTTTTDSTTTDSTTTDTQGE